MLPTCCRGDVQHWELLPSQAALNVRVGSIGSGSLGFPEFPKWLGMYSRENKRRRLLSELSTHLTSSISGGPEVGPFSWRGSVHALRCCGSMTSSCEEVIVLTVCLGLCETRRRGLRTCCLEYTPLSLLPAFRQCATPSLCVCWEGGRRLEVCCFMFHTRQSLLQNCSSLVCRVGVVSSLARPPQAVRLSYMHFLKANLTQPLREQGADGAQDCVELLEEYGLSREDLFEVRYKSTTGSNFLLLRGKE